MTTPNLGLPLVAGADTIGAAFLTKHNSALSLIDAAVAAKYGSGAPIANLITTTSASNGVPLVAKGILGQTANLFEARSNVDAILLAITSGGGLLSNANVQHTLGTSTPGGALLTVDPFASTNKALVIRGQSGQSANLQEWQNSSSTVLASIRSDGVPFFNGGAVIGTYPSPTAFLNVGIVGASVVGTIIRGAASQSVNLQEWQNNSGTVLAAIESNGAFHVGTALTGWASINAASDFKGLVIRGSASQTTNLLETQTSGGTQLFCIRSNGAPQLAVTSSTATAGLGGALPAQVLGYFVVYDAGGVQRRVPYYDN